jgi:hypothetical protein
MGVAHALECRNNKIHELDVHQNPKLTYVDCDSSVEIIKHDWQEFHE